MAERVYSAIERALESNEGALIGRNGTIELDLLTVDAHSRDTRPFILEKHAGVFPMNRDGTLQRWRAAASAATKASDVLAAGWYAPLAERERDFLHAIECSADFIHLRDLEPYYSETVDWTKLLAGQKVAVVTSFASTVSEQSKRLSKIWGLGGYLTGVKEWEFVQTGYAPVLAQGKNEWPSPIKSWEDAVDYCVSRVMTSGARFALIGCGGLGMIIGHRLKQRGIICIVLGGALQILFGIKGRRWETHAVISKLWSDNDSWVYPKVSETPGGAKQIEGGCYWA